MFFDDKTFVLVEQVVAGKPGRVETPKRKALRAAVSATIENIRFIIDTSSPSNSLILNLKQV